MGQLLVMLIVPPIVGLVTYIVVRRLPSAPTAALAANEEVWVMSDRSGGNNRPPSQTTFA
jgi:hypothetical protein